MRVLCLVVALFAAGCASAPREQAAAPAPVPPKPFNAILTIRTYFKGEARALLERYYLTKDQKDGEAFATYCENTPMDEWAR